MYRRNILVGVAVFLLISVFYISSFAGHIENPRRDGYIICKYKDDAPEINKGKAKNLLESYSGVTERELRLNAKLEKLYNKKSKTEEDICAELMATGAFEFAEPDYIAMPTVIPNDPGYSNQWFHSKINSPGAWDIETGNLSIRVAVCDTGVDSTHPDLAYNMLLPGYNSADGSTNTEPVASHGTAVAGCIAAIGNNGIGVSGSAWNVSILPIRVTNRSDGTAFISDIGEAIIWATDQKAHVVNISYNIAEIFTNYLQQALKYAHDNGTLPFVAAANSGKELVTDYYGSSCIIVGATDSNDAKASWSNYGAPIDIVAPGVSIYTTIPNSGYSNASGTSFSSPIAAGVGALIFSLNPAFTLPEVEYIIFSTCVDLGDPGEDNIYGNGRIDSASAVTKALNLDVLFAPSDLVATVNGKNVNLNWKDNSSIEGGFYIERRVRIKGKETVVQIVVGTNTTNYIDENLSDGTYKYRVQAFNSTTTSDYSNEASASVSSERGGKPPPKK